MEPTDQVALDGNAVAGGFAEIFAVDVTSAKITCASCSATQALAEQATYIGGPGAVVRCSSCAAVVARLVQTPHEAWLDLSGSVSWQIPFA